RRAGSPEGRRLMALRAVVLLGGAGTRLRPLTLAMPKQVLPIVEVPMIERVLDHLAAHGVTEAVLSLGYLHEAFVSLFPAGGYGGLTVTYAIEPEPLDTGGAIRFAAVSAGMDERFLVVNGDILTDLDITAMLAFHASREGAMATIATSEVEDSSAFGLVITDGADGRVTAFLEKPAAAQAGPGHVNAGTYVFEPGVIAAIDDGRRVSVEREVFPGLVAGRAIYAFSSPDYWTDTGTPAQYLQAQLDLVSGRRPGIPAPGAVDDGSGVWTIGDVAVDGHVEGPALLASGAMVAAGARVSNSILGSGAVVDAGAHVERAILLGGSTVGPDATVTDSIVGPGAVVGEGAVVSAHSVIGGGVKIEPGRRVDGERVPDGV
ncbi:MAG: mannose-phosphate guanylyltransferase, partial [Actinomycetota bacterium]|nr:mannose-phosphate guanylyltransferase [Actinomycetota bacterium]